jgi:hypothetical protein
MFDPKIQAPIGDDLLYPFHYLAQVAREHDISVSTIDIEPLDSYNAIIFLDYPGNHNWYLKKLIDMKFENLYLFVFENEIIKPDNWKMEHYRYFKKIFTWRDDIIDNKKIFKFFLPNKIPDMIAFDTSEKNKFCCLIAGNKKNNHPLELYSERVLAIEWFEKNQPAHFDLYGKGWDTYSFSGIFSPLNRIRLMIKLFTPRFPSLKGAITSKHEILEQYKFSICYENARDIPGYITEKIFDCFFAGCIPVYWGASNITRYIPENTFIDRRKFDSYEQLYDFMVKMDDRAYLDYVHHIETFVNGPEINPFSADNFCATIIRLMTEG